MEEKIRIENVTKKFGSYAALDGISLSFEKGKIHGMIGRNGSGKTVLFRATAPDRICSFLPASAGRPEKKRSMRLSEKSGWIRKRRSMSVNIPSVCASASALHRRLWKNLPS